MAKASPRAAAASTLPLWASLCFFASGAAGLLYEIVWSKQLTYVLGSSLHAVATVAAAFLGGLAFGALVLGVPIARRGSGARTYALLELGVALLGVGLLPLLRGVEPVFGQFYRQFGGESAGFAIVRFVMLFVLLLPPTVLMGATLPVLVEQFERNLVGPALARLYALNTFGAVVGSALGGFVLMPGLGLAGTTCVAGALNVVVAALAWVAGGASVARRNAPEAPAAGSAAPAASTMKPVVRGAVAMKTSARSATIATPLTPTGTALLALLFALSGFAALAFQIAWVRLFSLVFGSSVYSFAGVLGVYLFGLGLGSAAISFMLRRGASVALFARLQLALAAVAALGLHAFSRLPDRMLELATRSGGNWGALFAGQLGLIAMLLLVPCALFGAVFPVATRLLQRSDSGQAAGFAYAVNTAGTIAGSLIAGFVLVPSWGVQGTHLAALTLSGAIGLAALLLACSRGETRWTDLGFAVAAVAAVVLLASSAPPWDPRLMSAGVFRPSSANDMALAAQAGPTGGTTMQRATRAERVLYYKEGENGSVLVGSDAQDQVRWLRVGGKIDASTSDMETQVLLGLLPSALADSGARSLVIGLGSGYTAASVLAAGAGSTDVVELERGVVEASGYFFPRPELNPLRDPRVHLILGDARTHLAHTRTRYGLIVSEPSNPWIAGVNNLFTVDFYQRVRARLEPDGVFCQWMQLYEISPETIGSMIASFLKVFPEGEVFTVWRAVDLLLVAAPRRRAFALERLRSPDARRMLDAAHIAAPEDVSAYWTGPIASLAPLARGATLNRDDRPIVEYRAPRDLVAVGRAALTGSPGATRLVPFAEHMPDGPVFAAWPREDWYARRARHLIALADTTRARAAIAGARAEGFRALAGRLDGEVEAGVRRREAEQVIQQATNLLALGRAEEGRLALERAAAIDPSDPRAWLLLCDRRRVARDFAGAEAALARVVPGDSEQRADASVMRSLLALARRDTASALASIHSAVTLGPTNPRAYLFEARLRIGRGDLTGARAALQRGLAVLPGNSDLANALNDLGP